MDGWRLQAIKIYSPVYILLYFDFNMKFKLIMDFNMIYIGANKFGGMMKKIWLSVLMGMMVLMLNGGAFAAETWVYRPYYKAYSTDSTYRDLDDLEHQYAYSWAIDTAAGNDPDPDFYDSTLTFSASLTFVNIKNHDNKENYIHVNVLDNSVIDPEGLNNVVRFSDNAADNDFSNYFIMLTRDDCVTS